VRVAFKDGFAICLAWPAHDDANDTATLMNLSNADSDSDAAPDAATWARLSPLLDEALDLPAPERAAWLLALQVSAPQDAALLRGLLHRHEAASREGLLAGAAHAVAADPASGHRMGPWTIEAPLGEGGMASVWLARRSDGRHEGQAAIKLMHGRLHGTQASQRFEREGRILARLEHPHIARLLDAGVASDGDGGQPYLVLELVRGEPIDRWCDERQLDVEGRLRLFVNVVQAVAAAHAQLVVHRDLKPGNVMVDGQGQVKLLDFGIARLLDEGDDGAAPSASFVTRTGQRAYTPAWAAPEQVRGEPVSTATDVWALGVLLCQLLTGRHPSGLPWTSELTAWMQAAALPDMKRPSRLAAEGEDAAALATARGLQPLRLARRLQGELDQIVLRALAEEPGRRYTSAQALADDVQRHLRNEPVSAVADTVGYRATKFVRRNRLAVGAASTTLLALLAGVLGTTWQALEARAQRDAAQTARIEAVAQAQRAVRERDAAEATDEFLGFLLTSTPGKAITAKELLIRGEEQALRQFKDAPLFQARLQLTLAGLYSEIDEPDRMRAVLDSARLATDAAGPEAAGLRALGDCMRASDLIITPDQAVADAAYDAALPVLRSGPQADAAMLVSCLSFRAVRTTQAGLPKDAAEQSREALQVLGTPRPGQRSLSLALRLGLAWNTARMGELGAGIQTLRAGLLELEQMGRGHTGGVVSWTNNLAILEAQAGQPLAAVASLERVLVLEGPDERPMSRINLAQHQFMVGRTKAAVDNGERGRDAARASGDLFGVAMFDAAYVGCPEAVGRAACRQRREDSRRQLQAVMQPSNTMFARLDMAVGQDALAHSEVEAANRAFASSLAIFDASPRFQPTRTLAAALLARTESKLGRHASALELVDSAVMRARTLWSAGAASGLAHSAWLGQALLAQAVIRKAAGQADAARKSVEEALPHLRATMGETARETREAVAFVAAR
jgi:eukaryotic-like serine/threonine-protein kinase